MPVIRIDDDVWKELQKRAEPLVDTPNSVIRKLLNLNMGEGTIQPSAQAPFLGKVIEIPVSQTPTMYRYLLFPLPPKYREFFPGFRLPFQLDTDVGVLTTHVTSAPHGTLDGDPKAGARIQSHLAPWLNNHRNLKSGDKLRFEITEPFKKYKLSVIRGQ